MIWKLSDEKYEYIKGEVVHLFKQYGIKCIPVSGFELASKMGIILVAYSSLSQKKLNAARRMSEDGFYCETDGQEFIFYNDIEKDFNRQNMTILHEIGHCVLDHTGRSEREESEASFFAKFAIAPPVFVERIGANSPEDIHSGG